MASWKKIAERMEATLRAEGANVLSSAKPNQDHIDEFVGRLKIAAWEIDRATFPPPDNTEAWMRMCPAALALIVGRAPLDTWKLLEYALAGLPATGVGAVLARYRGRLSSGKDLTKARAAWEALGKELV